MLFSAFLATILATTTVTGAPIEDTFTVNLVIGNTYGMQMRPNTAANTVGFCLGFGSVTNGTPAVLKSCSTSAKNQKVEWDGSRMTLTGSSPLMCLDVPNGVRNNGVKLQWWQCASGSANQQFTYNGVQLKSGTKCVDLSSGGLWDGNGIQLYDCAGNYNNQWWTPVFWGQ